MEAQAVTADLSEAAVIRVAEREGLYVDDLRVINYSPKHLPVSRVAVHRFQVNDDVDGRVHLVVLNEAGQEVDMDQLLTNERTAYADAYGKLSRELFRRLRSADSEELIHVRISVDVPVYPDPPQPPSGLSRNEVDQLLREYFAQERAAWKPITGGVAERVAQMATDAAVNTIDRWVYARMRPDAIKQAEAWDEVRRISVMHTAQPDLENARGAIDAQDAYKRHLGGWGVKVAITEARGGLISTANPYLHVDIQEEQYACTSDHGTAVAGIIRSSHIDHFGIAPGAELWAGGSCGGVLTELETLADKAISSGARVLNLSWGSSSGDSLDLDGTDNFYDSKVWFDRITVTKSAGNRSPGALCPLVTGDRYVSHPGLGYNVITVGAFNDMNTPDNLDDDRMYECSSYLNPTSTSGDRIKPEVVAPGVQIYSTTTSAPWIGNVRSGSSYAAPMVAAGAAMLMQRTGDLEDQPEAVKAILMATAWNNIHGNARLSSNTNSS